MEKPLPHSDSNYHSMELSDNEIPNFPTIRPIDDTNFKNLVQKFNDKNDFDSKIEKAIKKMENLDNKLKEVLQAERVVKEKSIQQSRQTFSELVAISANTSDTKSNIEKYLSLLPPHSKTTSSASSYPKLKTDPRIYTNIFQTQADQESTTSESSTIKNEDTTSQTSETSSNTQNSKLPFNDNFIKRNMEFTKNSANCENFGIFMTRDESDRLEEILNSEDEIGEDERPMSGLSFSDKRILPSISGSMNVKNLAISFLPKEAQDRLSIIESKLSNYKNFEQDSTNSVISDTESIISKSSILSSQLETLKNDQSKMNFVNKKLSSLREPNKNILPSNEITNLAKIYLTQHEKNESFNIERQREIENVDLSLGNLVMTEEKIITYPKLEDSVLKELLANARIELNIEEVEEKLFKEPELNKG